MPTVNIHTNGENALRADAMHVQWLMITSIRRDAGTKNSCGSHQCMMISHLAHLTNWSGNAVVICAGRTVTSACLQCSEQGRSGGREDGSEGAHHNSIRVHRQARESGHAHSAT